MALLKMIKKISMNLLQITIAQIKASGMVCQGWPIKNFAYGGVDLVLKTALTSIGKLGF